MKTAIMGILGVMTVSSLALAQGQSTPPEYEVICRMKAKEIAADTYRGCITNARSQQIDQLKKDYQEKLRAMKQDYESELKRLGNGRTAAAPPAKKAPGKKAARNKTPALTAKPVASAAPQPAAPQPVAPQPAIEEMSVELRQAPTPTSDESMLDIPDPMPIEDVPTVGASL